MGLNGFLGEILECRLLLLDRRRFRIAQHPAARTAGQQKHDGGGHAGEGGAQPAATVVVVARHMPRQAVLQIVHGGCRGFAQHVVEKLMQLVDLAPIGIYPFGRSRVFRQPSLYLDAPLGIQAAINVSMQIAVIDGSRHHIIVLLDPAEWHSALIRQFDPDRFASPAEAGHHGADRDL